MEPTGTCKICQHGTCHARKSSRIVQLCCSFGQSSIIEMKLASGRPPAQVHGAVIACRLGGGSRSNTRPANQFILSMSGGTSSRSVLYLLYFLQELRRCERHLERVV